MTDTVVNDPGEPPMEVVKCGEGHGVMIDKPAQKEDVTPLKVETAFVENMESAGGDIGKEFSVPHGVPSKRALKVDQGLDSASI